jgi:hypothetical protein
MTVKKKFPRGTKVLVVLKGIVVDSNDDMIRVSIKRPKQKESWWAVVPVNSVQEILEL